MIRDDLSSEGRQLIARYADRGWLDAAGDDRLRSDFSPAPRPRPAYLVLASGIPIPPTSSVQVTTRCNYRAFRGSRLIATPSTARRFDLLDLKVLLRSQFRRDEALPLRGCAEEATPDLIQWPLEVCGAGGEFVVSARIPSHAAEDDPGAALEMLVIGEVL